MRNIEAFPEEVLRLGQGTLCQHGKVIQYIIPAEPVEQPQYSAIEIPELSCDTRALRGAVGGLRGPESAASLGSSISVEKLEAVKADLEKAYQEVLSVHEQLTKAVEEVDEDQLHGYDYVYSEEALSAFADMQV